MRTVTQGDLERIGALLRQGLSSAEIALELGDGRSRNAVQGIVYRYREQIGVGFSRPPGWQAKSTRQDSGKAGNLSLRARRARQRSLKAKAPAFAPEPVTSSVVAIPEPEPLNLTLCDLAKGQCKWPVNDPPRGGVFLFCGHDAEGPYCAHHTLRAIGEGTASERRAVRDARRAG